MTKRPEYYGGKDSTYEVIKVIRAWNLNFSLGNVLKYIARAGKKHDNILEDLEKAKTYIQMEIDSLKGVDDPKVNDTYLCDLGHKHKVTYVSHEQIVVLNLDTDKYDSYIISEFESKFRKL